MNNDGNKGSKPSNEQVEKKIRKVIRLGKMRRQNIFNRLRAGKPVRSFR